MEDEHRTIIQKNFVSLVERTDLDKMVATLFEKGVFSEQMIEPYTDTTKDARSRKRQLYMDITRRGPRAFGLLLEALSESGYWDIVRELDPNSSLRSIRPQSNISSKSDESNYVSIRNEKMKTKNGVDLNKNLMKDFPTPAPHEVPDDTSQEIPRFNVVKSTKFIEDTDQDGSKLKLYPTRGPNRGYLVVFSYFSFLENTDERRPGADVDCKNLKYLFAELGIKVITYQNCTKKETLEALVALRSLEPPECMFLVVSSHGYERRGSSDVDVRCADGGVLRVYEFIDHFHDDNFPALRGIPKVFIFQICRGTNRYSATEFPTDGRLSGSHDAPVEHLSPPDTKHGRVYNDILIAHSTIPGYVSYRDSTFGSWYIQVMCKVFAEHAHDTHVEQLFALVDKEMKERFHVQTSERCSWGFNRHLYLHPGLPGEGPPPAPHPAPHAAT